MARQFKKVRNIKIVNNYKLFCWCLMYDVVWFKYRNVNRLESEYERKYLHN
mgnify:CR=1 FL=1